MQGIVCFPWMSKKCDMISEYSMFFNLILHQLNLKLLNLVHQGPTPIDPIIVDPLVDPMGIPLSHCWIL